MLTDCLLLFKLTEKLDLGMGFDSSTAESKMHVSRTSKTSVLVSLALDSVTKKRRTTKTVQEK